MKISTEILERRSLLSVAESLQLMIGFESLLISLISLIVVLIKKNKIYDEYFKPENPYRCKFDYENGTSYGLQYLGRKEFCGRREFTADEYIEYIHTHSDHTAIKEDCREPFFEGIRNAIVQFGDRIVFQDTYVLYLYKK